MQAYPPFRHVTENAPECTAVSISEVDFTLVTQLSSERIWMMGQHCQRWGKHPISIAILSNRTHDGVWKYLMELGCQPDQVTLNVAPAWQYPPEDYPVNALRNLALSSVKTTHAVIVDVDFWPASDLYDTLMNAQIRTFLARDPKTAFTIPTFQLEPTACTSRSKSCYIETIPHLKEDVVRMHKEGLVSRFDPTNKGGQGSTLYNEWMEEDKDRVFTIPCATSNRYEPVLAVRYCRDLPPFQEAFTGYGKNRLSWFLQVRRTGWLLWESSRTFVIHFPHPSSKARRAWNGGTDGSMLTKKRLGEQDYLKYKRGMIDRIFVDFRHWLEANVPDQTRLLKCVDATDDDANLWVPQDHIKALNDKIEPVTDSKTTTIITEIM
jgi:Glycosyl-transferase for dystroglycan